MVINSTNVLVQEDPAVFQDLSAQVGFVVVLLGRHSSWPWQDECVKMQEEGIATLSFCTL